MSHDGPGAGLANSNNTDAEAKDKDNVSHLELILGVSYGGKHLVGLAKGALKVLFASLLKARLVATKKGVNLAFHM